MTDQCQSPPQARAKRLLGFSPGSHLFRPEGDSLGARSFYNLTGHLFPPARNLRCETMRYAFFLSFFTVGLHLTGATPGSYARWAADNGFC